MAGTVTKANTKIYRKQNGWINIIYDTGQKDDKGNAITLTATLTQASIEKEAGVLLPKARVKAILEATLNGIEESQEQELAAL